MLEGGGSAWVRGSKMGRALGDLRMPLSPPGRGRPAEPRTCPDGSWTLALP